METQTLKCRYCEQCFTFATNRRRHEKKVHNIFKETATFDCEMCKFSFPTVQKLNLHISTEHQDLRGKEELTFNSMLEFERWKIEMEKRELSSYFLSQSYKLKNGDSVRVYSCHRSGNYKGKGKGVRHLKIRGSNKIGTVCPASIKLTCNDSCGTVKVSHYPTHMGHELEVGRLRLNKAEKEKIAGQLGVGERKSIILDDIAKNASPTKRIAATNTQDIRNIAASYGVDIGTVRSQDDFTSVNSWVMEMMTRDENPILMYKPPGELDDRFPSLDDRDFVLGFMNDAQREIFKLYGHEVVSIDSTHGTNKYDIQLTSIVIKDDNWEGFPVAFLWTNRQHEEVFRYFFEMCRKQIGELKVKAFITEDYPAFYNSWSTVFGSPQYNLLCDWHVKRAWKKNVCSGTSLIKDLTKRQEVLNYLYALSNEVDEITFVSLLKVIENKLLNDPDTAAFGAYFKSNYSNITRQWAACYRVGANITTNIEKSQLRIDPWFI